MGTIHALADDLLYLGNVGAVNGLGIYRKQARDVTAGEYVWCFVVDAYAPEVRGHFEFVKAVDDATVSHRSSRRARWFNQSDGPELLIPDDWYLFEGPQLVGAGTRQAFRALAHPGYLHDVLPTALGFELFSSGFTSPKLTEAAAYFLGAFALRPQMQPNGPDTWGVFATAINQAGKYGTSSPSRYPILAQWLAAHRNSVEQLAHEAWGAHNFYLEQSGSRLGLPNIATPVPLTGSRQLLRGGTGFAIHAPIARGMALSSTGRPSDVDLRLIQYWYSCIQSNLLERTAASVKKAFVLGALDTVSNADSSRRSIGLDFNESFVGEFPLYSAIHQVGELVLETFEGDETGNPRVTPGRTRGRIPRCRIYDATQNIGFISGLRFARAKDYEPDIAGISSPVFPTPNVLSVILGVPVHTVRLPTNFGSSEQDLTSHKLFRAGEQITAEFASINVGFDNAIAACSLPLGTFSSVAPPVVANLASLNVRLATATWEAEALDKISKINDHLPALTPLVPPDVSFEYLVCVLASTLPGCVDSWVVPRSEDQGVDVGATFNLGAGLGTVTAVFQAKLQATRVGRRVVDMLRGGLFREGAQIGYVVTNNAFTTRAIRSAEQDHPEVRLIGGTELVALLLGNQVGLFQQGGGVRRKFYLDLSFFAALRALAAARAGATGKIRIQMDPNTRLPAFRP